MRSHVLFLCDKLVGGINCVDSGCNTVVFYLSDTAKHRLVSYLARQCYSSSLIKQASIRLVTLYLVDNYGSFSISMY
jgi:hypothetical protein